MNTSEQLNELATALAKAQADIKNAAFNKVNPHFKSKYADLAAIRDAVTPSLAKNGLSIVQMTGEDNGKLIVKTRLLHSSGQWLQSDYPITNDLNSPQKMGSALTYARRYSLAAICGIASEEDDDGNEASKPAPKNGNSKMDLAVKTPDERGPDTPFPEITGQTGRPKYKSEKNDAPAEYLFLQSTIRALRTENDLLDWIADETNKAAINKLPADWIPDFREEYKDRLAALRAAA